MPSTYSDLKFEILANGEQAGTWGTTTNTNIGTAIEEAITGAFDVSFSGMDVTLTLVNSNASQAARNLRLNLVGTSGGARQLILGSGCQINKQYIVKNSLADTVTIKNTTGSGVAVEAGKSTLVFNDGTDVTFVVNTGLNNPILSGDIFTNGPVRSNVVAVSALDIDCALGNYFTKTINANSTFTFSNAPTGAFAFTLELTQTSGTVEFPADVQFPNQIAPTLTTGRTHLFTFVTDDGGARWRGVSNVNYTT